MKFKPWLAYALITTLFWGVWGAFSELPVNAGFPGTLVYVFWSLSMVPPALAGLKIIDWKLEHDWNSIGYGLIIGILGAGGALALMSGAIENGPAYLIFPIISLSPVITIIISIIFLKERASKRGWIGIIIALIAIPLLSYQGSGHSVNGILWLPFALIVFIVWGVQAVFMKLANRTMKAESIFFYMMLSGIMLAPIALFMTDFSEPITWGFKGPYLTFFVQLLNSIGALCIVYALRYGKAIVVSPLTNAVAPMITVALSLIIYSVIPHTVVITGMLLSIVSVILLAFEDSS